jgi:hypothetical protein
MYDGLESDGWHTGTVQLHHCTVTNNHQHRVHCSCRAGGHGTVTVSGGVQTEIAVFTGSLSNRYHRVSASRPNFDSDPSQIMIPYYSSLSTSDHFIRCEFTVVSP